MERISEEEVKNLFAEWGLWSLVEDISDDGDGEGDNLQLTKEGLKAHKMIERLLEERRVMGIDELFAKYREMCEVDLTLLNKKKNEKVSKKV